MAENTVVIDAGLIGIGAGLNTAIHGIHGGDHGGV
jgi:hypothetical protein